MTGVLNTGIKIASGVATIKNSNISSGGTGVGILLTDGGDHVLGVDGDNNFKNVLKNLTTGLQVSITGQDIKDFDTNSDCTFNVIV